MIQTLNLHEINRPVRSGGEAEIRLAPPVADASRPTFELGFWLASIESFLKVGDYAFSDEARIKGATRDWAKEFRLTRSGLAVCSETAFRLGKILEKQNGVQSPESLNNSPQEAFVKSIETGINAPEIDKLFIVLRNAILLNDALLRAAPLGFGEWTAWNDYLSEKLEDLPVCRALVRAAEAESADFLPPVFSNLLARNSLPLSLKTDLKLVLPRFARILKALGVVDKMLKNDQPLKASVLIFARVHQQINELIKYADNRLLRFSEPEGGLFDALDAAAYTASIELRKVYNHELAGLQDIRSTPSVYARVETAYSLLSDSFQQTLVGFAQLIEPEIKGEEIFPNFNEKLKQSLQLRRNLWEILQSVKIAEQTSEKTAIDSLHKQLNVFRAAELHFLFYKDMETVERFVEEVLITNNKKDLVPVLHRFGAYLETLFGQINMRAVLAAHPFEK